MLSKILLLIGVLAMFASWYVRVRLFAKAEADHTFRDLTEDTFVTTFRDLLFIQLYRRRAAIDSQFRGLIAAYFWLTIAAAVLLLAGGVHYWAAA